jgi:hypothetical protein
MVTSFIFSDFTLHNPTTFEGAGPAAMGNAAITFITDNNALLYNPACLADVKVKIVSFGLDAIKYYYETSEGAVQYASSFYEGYPSSASGQFSIVDKSFGFQIAAGAENYYDLSGSEVLLASGTAFKINDRLNLGVVFKLGSPFDANGGSGFAFDLGGLIKATDFLQFGIVWTNPILLGFDGQNAIETFRSALNSSDVNVGMGIKLPAGTLIQFEVINLLRQYSVTRDDGMGPKNFNYNERILELGIEQKIGNYFRLRGGIDYGNKFLFNDLSIIGYGLEEYGTEPGFTVASLGFGYDFERYTMDAFVSYDLNSGDPYPDRLGMCIKYYY